MTYCAPSGIVPAERTGTGRTDEGNMAAAEGTTIVINDIFILFFFFHASRFVPLRMVQLCNVNPCANGGTCWTTEESFYCACRPGFTGKMCEGKEFLYCDIRSCCLIQMNILLAFEIPGELTHVLNFRTFKRIWVNINLTLHQK